MLKAIYAIFKKGDTNIRVSAYIQNTPYDCGTFIVSVPSIRAEGRIGFGLSPRERREIMTFCLKRSLLRAHNTPNEYRKFIFTGHPTGGAINLSKHMRGRHMNVKSAHGGHPFKYGVVTLNLGDAVDPFKSDTLKFIQMDVQMSENNPVHTEKITA